MVLTVQAQSWRDTIKSFTFGAPVATTQAATDVKITSGSVWEAVLHGYINPNGFTSENFFRYVRYQHRYLCWSTR